MDFQLRKALQEAFPNQSQPWYRAMADILAGLDARVTSEALQELLSRKMWRVLRVAQTQARRI